MKTSLFLFFSLFVAFSAILRAEDSAESLQARLKREMDIALTVPKDPDFDDFALDKNGDLVETTERAKESMSDSVSLGQAGLLKVKARKRVIPHKESPIHEKEGSFTPPRRRSR